MRDNMGFLPPLESAGLPELPDSAQYMHDSTGSGLIWETGLGNQQNGQTLFLVSRKAKEVQMFFIHGDSQRQTEDDGVSQNGGPFFWLEGGRKETIHVCEPPTEDGQNPFAPL